MKRVAVLSKLYLPSGYKGSGPSLGTALLDVLGELVTLLQRIVFPSLRRGGIVELSVYFGHNNRKAVASRSCLRRSTSAVGPFSHR